MHELDFAGILIQVMDIARRFHLEIPPQLMLLLKTLVHVEGLGYRPLPRAGHLEFGKANPDRLDQSANESTKEPKRAGTKIPDLLLGAQDFPTLLVDSLNGLKTNQFGMLNSSMNCKVCAYKWSISKTQLDFWQSMAILLSIAIISPWFISVILIVLTSLLAVWRVFK